MPIGTSDGQRFQDEGEFYASAYAPGTQTPKVENNASAGSSGPSGSILASTTMSSGEVSKAQGDAKEIAANQASGSFENRFDPAVQKPLRRIYIPTNNPLPEDRELQDYIDNGILPDSRSWGQTFDDVKTNLSKLKDVKASDIIKGLAHSIWSGLTLPGDVFTGKLDPSSPQARERAFELAGLMVLGPAPVAKSMADGTLGSFAGVRSRMTPELKDRLYKAQDMELVATHPDEIWQKTGFFKGADGRWRYEIADKQAYLNEKAFTKTVNQFENLEDETVFSVKTKPLPPLMASEKIWDKYFDNRYYTLPEVLEHPELYKAYPELKNIKIKPMPEGADSKNIAKFSIADNSMYIKDGLDPEYLRGVILHELTHGIQKIENFNTGGSHTQFLDKSYKAAEQEFTVFKKNVEEVLKEKGIPEELSKNYKIAIFREVNEENVSKNVKAAIEAAKKDGVYEDIKKIVKAEKMLNDEYDKALTIYKRLAGEVEARNVQTRRLFEKLELKWKSPQSTEDVPRFLQGVYDQQGKPY